MSEHDEALTVARRFDDEAFLCDFGGQTAVNLPNLERVIVLPPAAPRPEGRTDAEIIDDLVAENDSLRAALDHEVRR